MGNILPNFFIIGAPKCGTTALSEYLRLHPAVFFSFPKEPEYFATDIKWRNITRKKDYLRLFHSAEPTCHLAIGEGSTVYLYSEIAVSNILRFQPNAKIIVMLRNPVDLIVSFHAQNLMSGKENISNFVDAWNSESDRRDGKKIPISCRNPQFLYYSDWGKLGTQLKRVMDIVPRDQLKVILFDDFIHDTQKVYQEVLEFLVLPNDGRTQFPRVNERRSPRSKFLQSILGVIMHYWIPIRVKLRIGKSFGLGNFLNKFISFEAKKKQVPNDVRQMLLNFYKDEVVLLESLINRDLGYWRDGNHQ